MRSMEQVVFKPEVKLQLEQIVERIIAAMPIAEIILFGSYAHGTAHKDSDFDICVLTSMPGTHTVRAVQAVQSAITPVQSMPVDLLVYPKDEFFERSKTRSFERTIAQEGVRLYVQ